MYSASVKAVKPAVKSCHVPCAPTKDPRYREKKRRARARGMAVQIFRLANVMRMNEWAVGSEANAMVLHLCKPTLVNANETNPPCRLFSVSSVTIRRCLDLSRLGKGPIIKAMLARA